MSTKKITESFYHACRGLQSVFRSERNFRFQVLAGVVALALALYLPLKIWELILVILMVILVLLAEIVNTVFEYFTDLLKPRLHHYVEAVKDIMAGGVLVASVGAVVIGLLIFLPYLIK
ncbi:MAG: hypothetical protein A3J93_01405 [Candidatus Magasanikbacteria bacterium RIFOXYC2_FULL_42_28]|uniref:Diacylglycerol kinase n=1 Tax=Candidatus Magasanikbacteria bacterium RIFOXYC2_FULL_42_28 TaxID=1798704 RepID=A0A1F6NXU7_9BACT|nr:MAG: hypothetical protein A3J93_01405 [Candidatus Magasanikbacteria bacterium RIFOXYC2_FULL_42_28]